jgi:glycosyltransferase involved in cell wall biosynthesis
MRPLISVLVDTYNHERYIEQALASVIGQDFPPSDYEIVVVDDGSTDQTPEIVRKFAPRARLFRKPNGGQASAFNAALPELKGDVVAILDGDDWFAPGKLSGVMKAFGEHPEAGGVSHGHYEFQEKSGKCELRVPEGTKFISLETPEAAREALEWWQFLVVGALTVRRKVMENAVPISEKLRFCADGPIAWVAMRNGVYIFEEPLCYYRHHQSNLHASVEKGDRVRVQNKLKMDDLMFGEIERTLLRLSVSRDVLRESLYRVWIAHSRSSLAAFGGSRFSTLRTELRALRTGAENGLGLKEALHLPLISAGAMILPPEHFYKAQIWYEQRILRRFHGSANS